MPWWAWIWIAVMLAMTAGGAWMDREDQEPGWYTALGIATGLACALFVANYHGVLRLGGLVVPAVVTLAAVLYEAWHDLGTLDELTAGQRAAAAGMTVAVFAPATVLGMLAPGVS